MENRINRIRIIVALIVILIVPGIFTLNHYKDYRLKRKWIEKDSNDRQYKVIINTLGDIENYYGNVRAEIIVIDNGSDANKKFYTYMRLEKIENPDNCVVECKDEYLKISLESEEDDTKDIFRIYYSEFTGH